MMRMHRRLGSCSRAARSRFAQRRPTYSGLGADSVTPERRREVRAAAARSARHARHRGACSTCARRGSASSSPDGRSALLRLAHHRLVAGLPARPAEGLSDPDDRRRGATRRSTAVTPDGKWLVLVARHRRRRRIPALYLQPAPGGPLRARVPRAARCRPIFAFVTRRRPRALLPRQRRHARQLRDLPVRHRERHAHARVRREGPVGRSPITTGSGAALRLLLVKLHELARARVSSSTFRRRGKLTPLLGAGETVEYDAAYAAQPGELLVVTNKFRDFRTLYRWKIGADATRGELPRGAGARRDGRRGVLRSTSARRHVYAQVNDGGYTRLVVLDAKTYAPLALPLPADAEHVYAGGTTRRRPLRHHRRRHAAGAAHELRVGLADDGAHAVARAVRAGGRPRARSCRRSS